MFDSIVESVKNKYTDRSIRGIEKYKTTLDNNVTDNFLQHHQEELMDATLYIEKELSVKDSKLEMVRKFNKVFNISTLKTPSLISEEDHKLKYQLMLEELDEYKDACKSEDVVEIADAVVDLLTRTYINQGHPLQNEKTTNQNVNQNQKLIPVIKDIIKYNLTV